MYSVQAVGAASELIALNGQQFLGIPIALIGAAFLSLGAQLQHRGVTKVGQGVPGSSHGLNLRQLGLLLARPSWTIGTILLGLAVVFQLSSLYLSPIIVVQPLGAVSLVITAILNARVSRIRLGRRSIAAVALCVGGVGLFVTIAAFTTRERSVSDTDLVIILVILAAVLVAVCTAFVILRRRLKALVYIVGAGVLYGFVATLAKVVISRFQQGAFDALTLLCIVTLVVAVVAGAYFVQNAYSSGPPDLVIAGLTVIDPLVAVTMGIVVLQEAAQAPLWADVAFVAAGAVAITGVFMLAKYHPQNQDS